MKHWMAIGAIAIMATGLTLHSSIGQAEFITTPGLPAGWLSEGVVTGSDTVAVDRPPGGGEPDLVISRGRHETGAGPMAIYQTIDATPWRGRILVFASHARIHMDADEMRRMGSGAVAEIHVRCDGSQPGSLMSEIDGSRTRRWLEMNLPVQVAADARRCTFGVVVLAKAEVRLSRLKLKDPARDMEVKFARRMPAPADTASAGTTLFAEKAQETAANAAPMTAPNLELKQ